jgi:hypothetical protein
LSRVLSGVGYHQPPVYFVPVVRVAREDKTRAELGGRFRLTLRALDDIGDWSWMDNPFVATRPYRGLIVILLMFNSSDLKDSNNTLYELTLPDGRIERRYVVRDLGTALGSTGKIAPIRGDPDVFERAPFIEAIRNGYVEFNYDGLHQEIVRNRITPADVRWASELLARLSNLQWHDAFRAGGYEPNVSGRFIRRIREKIAQGLTLTERTER